MAAVQGGQQRKQTSDTRHLGGVEHPSGAVQDQRRRGVADGRQKHRNLVMDRHRRQKLARIAAAPDPGIHRPQPVNPCFAAILPMGIEWVKGEVMVVIGHHRQGRLDPWDDQIGRRCPGITNQCRQIMRGG